MLELIIITLQVRALCSCVRFHLNIDIYFIELFFISDTSFFTFNLVIALCFLVIVLHYIVNMKCGEKSFSIGPI